MLRRVYFEPALRADVRVRDLLLRLLVLIVEPVCEFPKSAGFDRR
jgi:hypothetical protein